MNTLPKAPPVVLAQAQALGLGSGTAAALEDLITLAARWRAEAGDQRHRQRDVRCGVRHRQRRQRRG
jgi:hypothetical protein